MKKYLRFNASLIFSFLLTGVSLVTAQGLSVAEVTLSANSVTFVPLAIRGDSNSMVVNIMAPDDTVVELRSNGTPVQWYPAPGMDGVYRYEVWVITAPEGGLNSNIAEAEENNAASRVSGSFYLQEGIVIYNEAEPLGFQDELHKLFLRSAELVGSGFSFILGAALEFTVASANAADLTASSENPIVFFQDTNTTYLDWAIIGTGAGTSGVLTINDILGNGGTGGNNHSIIRLNGSINNTSNQNSMVVDANGDIRFTGSSAVFIDNSASRLGVGTTTPPRQLSIAGGSPTISLNDVDGVVWEINSNNLSNTFDIANVTDGNSMFVLRRDAPTNSLVIDDTGIGVGTSVPDGSIHVLESTGENPSLVLETQGGAIPAKWEIRSNPATGRLSFRDLNGRTIPFKFAHDAVNNLLRVGIVDNDRVDIKGNLVVTGNCTEQNGACADYVFEDDYELRSLDELAQFVNENRHLPNVPSAEEIKSNGVNLANMSGRLLEKVEELTLYTIQQEQTIQSLKREHQNVVDELQKSTDELMKRSSKHEKIIEELYQRLARLEN